MKRILVLYYSQSGEAARAVQSFTRFLDTPEVELVWEEIRPQVEYPYPWKSAYEFFDVFPECVNGEPPPIHPPSFAADAKFDLIILAYQVWFLAPSLPIQGFLQSEQAHVLRNTRVITLVVCRSMWYTAAETMRELIANAGGILIDNVVVTFKGPPLATFITTPRKLLSGKSDKFMGLPEAETHQEDIQKLERFGQRIAANLEALDEPTCRSLLQGMGAVEIKPLYALMERAGYYTYHYPWAKIARRFGRAGSQSRKPIIYLFLGTLVLTLPLGILVATVMYPLLYLLFRNSIDAYLRRLGYPSGLDQSLQGGTV